MKDKDELNRWLERRYKNEVKVDDEKCIALSDLLNLIEYMLKRNPYPEDIFPEASPEDIKKVHEIDIHLAGQIYAQGGRLAWEGALLRLKQEIITILNNKK